MAQLAGTTLPVCYIQIAMTVLLPSRFGVDHESVVNYYRAPSFLAFSQWLRREDLVPDIRVLNENVRKPHLRLHGRLNCRRAHGLRVLTDLNSEKYKRHHDKGAADDLSDIGVQFYIHDCV